MKAPVSGDWEAASAEHAAPLPLPLPLPLPPPLPASFPLPLKWPVELSAHAWAVPFLGPPPPLPFWPPRDRRRGEGASAALTTWQMER